jgi:hypothetical protein
MVVLVESSSFTISGNCIKHSCLISSDNALAGNKMYLHGQVHFFEVFENLLTQ